MTLLHIIAGILGLASGAVALYAHKGAKLHRKSGMIFVYAMLVLSATGAVMAALKPERISVIAGLLAFYLVTTGRRTVRGPVQRFHWIDAVAMLFALTMGIAAVKFGLEALNNPIGEIDIFQIFLSRLMGDKRVKMHLSQPNAKDLDFIRALIEEDKIKPVIEKTYPLNQIVEAHRHVENGYTKGKVVVEIQKG